MKVLSLAALLLLLQFTFSSIAVAQQSAGDNDLLGAVKEITTSAIVAGWDSFSICEHVDRSNKPSYVYKLIPSSELPASDDAIAARHFVVQRDSESAGVDFSLYRIQFPSNETAMRSLSRIRTGKTGTLTDGKVLTRYAVQLDANTIYIIRTQSFLDPAMRSFLESFAREEIKVHGSTE